jgi:hypothetical protein
MESENMAQLMELLETLHNQIQDTAPAEKKSQALERASELKETVLGGSPEISTLEYIKNWFARNLPGLAGTVTGIVIHPIVGKLVEAAGEAAAAEFRRRFNLSKKD